MKIYLFIAILSLSGCLFLSGCTSDPESPEQELPDSESPEQELPDSESPEQELPDSESPEQELPLSEKLSNSPFSVLTYVKDKTYDGTTLFSETYSGRIVEVNMLGEIIWEYTIPSELKSGGNSIGPDVERLANDNILFVLSGSGVYEINRDGKIVWSYEDPKVSHDADRLANGNTLIVFGNNDKKMDAQVKEVDFQGEIVWQWFAQDAYGDSTFTNVEAAGWTHTNAVQRLSDGSTMISLRNFYLTVIVDEKGEVIQEFDWSSFGVDTDPHEPEINEAKNSLLVCLQNDSPYVALERDMESEEILWTYSNNNLRTTRDCDKLANGNVLLVAVDRSFAGEQSVILEITPEGEIVWKLILQDIGVGKQPGWFYKAERIS